MAEPSSGKGIKGNGYRYRKVRDMTDQRGKEG